jgi:hypothetical protein
MRKGVGKQAHGHVGASPFRRLGILGYDRRGTIVLGLYGKGRGKGRGASKRQSASQRARWFRFVPCSDCSSTKGQTKGCGGGGPSEEKRGRTEWNKEVDPWVYPVQIHNGRIIQVIIYI